MLEVHTDQADLFGCWHAGGRGHSLPARSSRQHLGLKCQTCFTWKCRESKQTAWVGVALRKRGFQICSINEETYFFDKETKVWLRNKKKKPKTFIEVKLNSWRHRLSVQKQLNILVALTIKKYFFPQNPKNNSWEKSSYNRSHGFHG